MTRAAREQFRRDWNEQFQGGRDPCPTATLDLQRHSQLTISNGQRAITIDLVQGEHLEQAMARGLALLKSEVQP